MDRQKTMKNHRKKARAAFICGMILTVLLAVSVFLYGSPVMETVRTYIGKGRDAVWEYMEENDHTGTFRRRKLYLKEEEKSLGFIKKYLGKYSDIPDDTQNKNNCN